MDEKMLVRITGLSPLLMHNPQGANPTHPLVREIKSLTGKKTKTDEDLFRIMDLEYRLNIYWSDGVGVVLPAEMLEASIRNGARKSKKGKDIEAGLMITSAKVPVIYEGPRTLEELIADMEFRDVRTVVIKKNRVLRCRPRFNRWSLEFEIRYMPDVLNKRTIVEALKTAGRLCAVGSYRPRYGRYSVEMLN